MSKHERQRRRNFRQLIGLIFAVVVVYFGVNYYSEAVQNKGAVAIWFEMQGLKTDKYMVRVAANDAARERGLMYVRPEELYPNKGMLFVFPQEKIQTFWMKDTNAPLDMIFIDKSLKVVGVVEDAKPFSLDARHVDKPSQYVVELLAGTVKKEKINLGATLMHAAEIPSAH